MNNNNNKHINIIDRKLSKGRKLIKKKSNTMKYKLIIEEKIKLI